MFTDCISPPELDDKQLLAYLDDREADPDTMMHLKKCPHCREKAKSLDRLQKHLTSKLYRLHCPSPLELGEYHLRMLPASQMLVIRQHLTTCPHCAREIAELGEFMSDVEPTSRRGSLAELGQPLVAQLLRVARGSGALGAPALRGESDGPLTFEANSTLITLYVQPGTDNHVTVLGQVAAENQDRWTGAPVEIYEEGKPARALALDDLGAFQVEVSHPGSIEIKIVSPEGVAIQIPSINV